MKRNENKKSLTKKIVAGTGLALLLALVGYTGANTYAKYIESTNIPTQSATVAKWGYVATADSENLWGPEYSFDSTKGNSTTATNSTLTVDASNNTLAPGTTGYFELHINGSAEVLSSIKVEASSDHDVHYEGYKPVKWVIEGNATIGGSSITLPTGALSTAEMIAALNSISTTTDIAANTVVDIDLVVTWVWAFESGHDVEDTILGYLSYNGTTDGVTAVAPTVKYDTVIDFAVKVTIVQEQN